MKSASGAMTIIESSSDDLDDRLERGEDPAAQLVGGRAHHVAVPRDRHRRDARTGDDGEDAREPVVVHAREAEHRQAEAGHAAREEQLQLDDVLEPRHHAARRPPCRAP